MFSDNPPPKFRGKFHPPNLGDVDCQGMHSSTTSQRREGPEGAWERGFWGVEIYERPGLPGFQTQGYCGRRTEQVKTSETRPLDWTLHGHFRGRLRGTFRGSFRGSA